MATSVKGALKIQNPESDKARKKVRAPHMFDMYALKFLERRSIATEFGFLEAPLSTSPAAKMGSAER